MKILKESFSFSISYLSNAISEKQTTIQIGNNAFDCDGGVLVIDNTDNYGNSTPSSREFITYDGLEKENERWLLKNVKRGVYGSPAQLHPQSARVEAVPVYKETNIQTRPEKMLENCLRRIL
jgi:hypothetical protein